MRWMFGSMLLFAGVGHAASAAVGEIVADRYTTDTETWERASSDGPWRDARGRRVEAGRVRALADAVDDRMKQRRSLWRGTDAWHRVERSTVDAPADLPLPPSVLPWLPVDRALEPAHKTWRTVPTTGRVDDTWSTSAAKVGPGFHNVRRVALSDRVTDGSRKRVKSEGRLLVQLDAEGRPAEVVRVASVAGSAGCRAWTERALYTLVWKGDQLTRVDAKTLIECDQGGAPARFTETTATAAR